MEPMEINVTDDVKTAAVRETVNLRDGEVAVLCCDPLSGQAEVRVIEEGVEIETGIIQIIDLSETAAYGSYIDTLVDPAARLRVPGRPDILAIWDTDDDSETERMIDEYGAMVALNGGVDWDTWANLNDVYLYTLRDAEYDIWEMVVEDIEFGGRYVVSEHIGYDEPLPDREE